MKASFCFSFILLLTGSLFAQADSNTYILPELKIYQKSIKSEDTCSIGLDSNKLIVYRDTLFADPLHYNFKIGIADIYKISIRDGTYTIRGFLYGAAVGFVLGFLLGMSSAVDPPHSSQVYGAGAVIGFIVAFIGGGIGSAVGKSKPRYVDYDLDKIDLDKKRSGLKKVFELWKIQKK